MGQARKPSVENADQALARFGYKSELPRNLSMMSILGLSFAIMAVPFGLSTTMYITLTNGQAVTVLYGWIFVSLISLCIAASLAEICAVFPVAGGVYYWSAMLSSPEWAPLVSFVDGWLTLVGNWTVTLSVCDSNMRHREYAQMLTLIDQFFGRAAHPLRHFHLQRGFRRQ